MTGKKYLPSRQSRVRSLWLVVLVFGVYALDSSTIRLYIDNSIVNFILIPALWLGVTAVVYQFPKIRPKGKLRYRSFLNWWAFNFALIFIVVSVLAGLLHGLGKSPYDHSLKGLALNLLVIGSTLIAKELVRSYLVNNLADDENYSVFVIVALIITVTGFSFNRYIDFESYEDAVVFIAQYFAPEFSNNLLATYLAYLGGPLPAIIYMGVVQAFHWFSPVLPNLKWITAALLGILCPVFSLMAVQGMYAKETGTLKRTDMDEEGPGGWMATSLVSIALIWFSVGVFPIYPSVVATGSMEPEIKPGDVILVRKISDLEGLNKGDVIQFRRDEILISHRIIELVEKDGAKSFRTKGDNNSGPDAELVKPEQVKGKIIEVVPKVGWPTLLIKSRKDIPLEEIRF